MNEKNLVCEFPILQYQALIDKNHLELSISEQAGLLNINRTLLYYKSVPTNKVFIHKSTISLKMLALALISILITIIRKIILKFKVLYVKRNILCKIILCFYFYKAINKLFNQT